MTQTPSVSTSSAARSGAATPVPRTRTPSVIKWLLNERAALAGEAERLQQELAQLQAKAARVQAELPPVLNKITALDETMAALDSQVAPDAAGVVRTQGRHGKRGTLKAFIHEQVQAAGAAGIDTKTLTLLTASTFGVQLPTMQDYSDYRRSIVFPVLRRGRRDGLIEEFVAKRGGRMPSVWRWRGAEAVPSLAALRAQVAQAGGAVAEAPDERCNSHANQV